MIFFLKLSILIIQRLAVHQNGVGFRQQFKGAIRTSLTASYNDVQRYQEICYTHPHTLTDTGVRVQNGLYSKVALTKKSGYGTKIVFLQLCKTKQTYL